VRQLRDAQFAGPSSMDVGKVYLFGAERDAKGFSLRCQPVGRL